MVLRIKQFADYIKYFLIIFKRAKLIIIKLTKINEDIYSNKTI